MNQNRNTLHGSALKPHWTVFIAECDTTAFKKIYLHYYHYLTYIALKKGFSTSRTKDVLNELFLSVWENRKKLGHIDNHHNYLITVFLRKLYKKEIPLAECLSYDEFSDLKSLPSVEEEYIIKSNQQHLSDILHKFIGQLPTKQKSLIYQKFYLGLSYEEIAAANQISINTAYNTMYKALDKLKIAIGKEHLNEIYLALMAISILFFIFFIKQ
ncbi:hypothetical protein CA265_12205 [Sphingobacteriaceae bacterium GW460-11-11-14-LB5]|nr:hypothetical protein CA265_12205 [Sphingobacteriaceae bacterium GW460-11-11-14-LB5]